MDVEWRVRSASATDSTVWPVLEEAGTIGAPQEKTLLALLESHGDALARIARVYAGANSAEEDLYQEIMMQAWKSLPSCQGDSAAGTWLYRVALNTALTWRS